MSVLAALNPERFWASVEKSGTCWRWALSLKSNGYGQLTVQVGGRPTKLTAHRVSWMLANSAEIPNGLHVLHSCDNRSCVRPDHLRLGTAKDNVGDEIARRRNPRLLPRAGDTCMYGHPWDRVWGNRRGCSRCDTAAKERSRLRGLGVPVPKLKRGDRNRQPLEMGVSQ